MMLTYPCFKTVLKNGDNDVCTRSASNTVGFRMQVWIKTMKSYSNLRVIPHMDLQIGISLTCTIHNVTYF